MKRKIILTLIIMAILMVALCITSFATYIYQDQDGNEMLRFEMDSSNVITTYTGSFPKEDSEGNALTWYVTSTTNEGGNTIKRVASVKTLDSAYFTLEDGVYSYGGTSGNVVTQFNAVSVNFPYDAGITHLNLANGGYKGTKYSYDPFGTEILFVYLPNTLKELPERIVQISKALVCDIPNEAPFTSISRVAFYQAKCLREVNIPSSVEAIYSVDEKEGTTFYQCVSLKKVTFGENSKLKEIQKQAFYKCTSLSEITLPDSLKKLGVDVFRETALVNSPFTRDSQCESIGSGCFNYITTLKSFIIPNGITTLKAKDFIYGCGNLTYVGFGNNPKLTTIQDDCFAGLGHNNAWLPDLAFDTIPDSVTYVGNRAFQGTKGMTVPFTESSKCTYIGHRAFLSCTGIEILNVPKDVVFQTDLSSYADGERKSGVFASCTSLREVNFHPETQIEILPAYMFAFCSSLTHVKIPNSVTTLSPRIFDRCTSLETIVLGANVTGINNGRAYSDNHNSLTYGCTSLKYVYMSKTLDMSSGHTDACHVFSTRDYTGTFENITFFIDGSYDDADRIQAYFKNVKTCNCNDRINNAEIISLEAYNALEEITKNYIVYGVNTCESFYGEHLEDNNPCVINCTRCESENVPEKNPIHNEKVTISYESITAVGTKITTCLNAGCSHSVTENAPILFVCRGYSVPEDERGGIAITYTVNKEAILEYESVMGITISYGVFAVAKSKLGDNDIFDENGNATLGVINAELTEYSFTEVDLKITGFSDTQKSLPLAIGAYAKITKGEITEYTYIQEGTPDANQKYCFITYDDVNNAQGEKD